MKKLLLVLLLVVVAVIAWGLLKRNTPPSVTFVRVKRETLVSTLPTNGKAEPFQWEAVRSQTEGLVNRVDVVAVSYTHLDVYKRQMPWSM